MKKICMIILCLLLATAAACGKKEEAPQTPSISDVPTTEADEAENADNEEDEGKGEAAEASDGAGQTQPEADTSDRTPQSDRREIENNIRDAQSLIDEGMTDDAKAVIRALRTRDLTPEEEKKVDDLEAQLLTISD